MVDKPKQMSLCVGTSIGLDRSRRSHLSAIAPAEVVCDAVETSACDRLSPPASSVRGTCIDGPASPPCLPRRPGQPRRGPTRRDEAAWQQLCERWMNVDISAVNPLLTC